MLSLSEIHYQYLWTLEKWDTFGTFTQKVPFLDYNKTKKEKSGTYQPNELWQYLLVL